MPYFILPQDNANLSLDPELFAENLRQQWTSVKFLQPLNQENILLEWTIKEGDVDHVGTLHNDRKTLTIDDYPAGVATFVLWYRSIIPEEYELFLCHDSDAELNLKITGSSQFAEITKSLIS